MLDGDLGDVRVEPDPRALELLALEAAHHILGDDGATTFNLHKIEFGLGVVAFECRAQVVADLLAMGFLFVPIHGVTPQSEFSDRETLQNLR